MSRIKQLAAVTAAVLAFTACDDGATTPLDGESQFTLVMAAENTAAFSMSSIMEAGDLEAARISTDNVASIFIPIGEVEALGASGGWVEAGSIDETIDLLNLPADGVVLLESTLPEGDYQALRFHLAGEPTIVLTEEVRVGRAVYEPGVEHALQIPSAEQNGLRLRADFTVGPNGETVTVLADGGATVRQIIATGAGALKIAPVLRVEGTTGDPDDDDADDEGEDEAEAEGIVSAVDGDTFTLEGGTVVRITDDTEISGDLLSLDAVADALAEGTTVSAEAKGAFDEDGTTIIATEVAFETD